MRKLLLLSLVGIGVFFVFWSADTAGAESLRIQPLSYQTELKKGEKKKGFVDITNPSNETLTVSLYANGFSQVNDKGELTFFDSEQIKSGLLLDYETATIGPRQTLRLYFVADGTKLPEGDVFGVIFAETQSEQRPGTNTTIRVGSLVMITNRTPGLRKAEIAKLEIPTVQFGEGIGGVVAIRNPAPKNQATGYFPEMSVELSPWGGGRTFKGPLVFAGVTRTFDFYLPAHLFGFYQVKVKANDAEKTTVIFVATGWWKVLAPLIGFVGIGGSVLLWRYRREVKQWISRRH